MRTTPLRLPAHIASLQAYESARSLFKGDDWVFLDANESAFLGIAMLPMTARLNRYPDPTSDLLRCAIASWYGLEQGNLFMGNGSDEIIDLLIRSLVRPGRTVVSVAPTYGMYQASAASNNVPYFSVPLREDFSIDDDALFAALQNADLLFLCSPNNPTGNVIDQSLIERILERFDGIVAIDEAYGEFADADGIPSSIELVKRGAKNLVVMRTFSKAFGAAGIRLGYCIADPDIIDVLLTVKSPYNINALTQSAGLQIWQDRDRVEVNVQRICSERNRLMQGCANLGCTPYQSQANFFLIEVPKGASALSIYQQLIERFRIVVRRFGDKPGLENILRITVGSSEENDVFLSSLRSLL